MKKLFLFPIVFVLFACGEKHEAYVGVYEYIGADDGLPKTLEVKKEGEIFYIIDQGKSPLKAEVVSGGLDLNGLLISFSDDQSSLSIGGKTAKRL